ncbi:hypothetical protein P9112_002806 [Eukaryota sp. TZLM1-RC]
MTSEGARLQNYNNELVRSIETLREKREEIIRQIECEKQEKAKIQADLKVLTERLTSLNESIANKQAGLEDFTRTIEESQNAFNKILESSHTLLNVLRRETQTLSKKKQHSMS